MNYKEKVDIPRELQIKLENVVREYDIRPSKKTTSMSKKGHYIKEPHENGEK